MASMLPPAVARIVTIILRVLIIIILFVTLMMLVTNSKEVDEIQADDGTTEKKTWRFTNEVGLQYAAAAIAIGIGYSIYGTVVMALRIKRGNDEGNLSIDFYGQKVLSNLLITAAVAGFLSVQSADNRRLESMKITDKEFDPLPDYWGRYKTCSGLVLLAFLLSIVLSILSSHTLARLNHN